LVDYIGVGDEDVQMVAVIVTCTGPALILPAGMCVYYYGARQCDGIGFESSMMGKLGSLSSMELQGSVVPMLYWEGRVTELKTLQK
jgi:hypothetical protein